jgi:putative Mn2+ efflux pump MntP
VGLEELLGDLLPPQVDPVLRVLEQLVQASPHLVEWCIRPYLLVLVAELAMLVAAVMVVALGYHVIVQSIRVAD